VSFQLDKLRRCLPQRIRRALDELPGTLDETYERTLHDRRRKAGIRAPLFRCVTVACRPLHVEELAEFLAFDYDAEGGPRFEAEWRPEDAASAVLSTCSSMISIVNVDDSLVVQFSHFSVKEFLTSTRIANGRFSCYYIPLELSHMIFTQACLSVLLQFNDHVTKSSMKKFLLADYAARHWVEHAKFGNVTSHIQDSMKQLFNPGKPHFAAWTWIFNMDPLEREKSERPSPPEAGPLYYSILCGFDEVAEWLVTTCSQDVNARGGFFGTALVAASRGGFLEIARLLLGHGANVNDPDFYCYTALHWASISGYLGLSRLLLYYGADTHATNIFGKLPLHLASAAGTWRLHNYCLSQTQIRIPGTGWGTHHSLMVRMGTSRTRTAATTAWCRPKRPGILRRVSIACRLTKGIHACRAAATGAWCKCTCAGQSGSDTNPSSVAVQPKIRSRAAERKVQIRATIVEVRRREGTQRGDLDRLAIGAVSTHLSLGGCKY
jgi:Ankyrin repeats (3 copies)